MRCAFARLRQGGRDGSIPIRVRERARFVDVRDTPQRDNRTSEARGNGTDATPGKAFRRRGFLRP